MTTEALSELMRTRRDNVKAALASAAAVLGKPSATIETLTDTRISTAALMNGLDADCATLDRERRAILLSGPDSLIAERERFVSDSPTSRERLQIVMEELDARINEANEKKRVAELRGIGLAAQSEFKERAERLQAELPEAVEALRKLAALEKESQAFFAVILQERTKNPDIQELQFDIPELWTVEREIEGLARSFTTLTRPAPTASYAPPPVVTFSPQAPTLQPTVKDIAAAPDRSNGFGQSEYLGQRRAS